MGIGATMIFGDQVGLSVRICYSAKKPMARFAPLRDAVGTVVVSPKGRRNRNYGVLVAGVFHVIPTGHLSKALVNP